MHYPWPLLFTSQSLLLLHTTRSNFALPKSLHDFYYCIIMWQTIHELNSVGERSHIEGKGAPERCQRDAAFLPGILQEVHPSTSKCRWQGWSVRLSLYYATCGHACRSFLDTLPYLFYFSSVPCSLKHTKRLLSCLRSWKPLTSHSLSKSIKRYANHF